MLGKNKAQTIPLAFSVYKYDILAIAIGKGAAHQIDEDLPFLLENKYGVKLSNKSVATRTFAKSVCAIGASYDLSDIRKVQCAPTAATVQKYVHKAQHLESGFGRLIPKA